jgi:hypothetical protein
MMNMACDGIDIDEWVGMIEECVELLLFDFWLSLREGLTSYISNKNRDVSKYQSNIYHSNIIFKFRYIRKISSELIHGKHVSPIQKRFSVNKALKHDFNSFLYWIAL